MSVRDAIKLQIEEYIKMYNNGGEPIGAEKIMKLFEGGVCPLCSGSGKVEYEVVLRPKGSNLKEVATNLRKQGLTIREIATNLGFKHPGSVSHLLTSKQQEK